MIKFSIDNDTIDIILKKDVATNIFKRIMQTSPTSPERCTEVSNLKKMLKNEFDTLLKPDDIINKISFDITISKKCEYILICKPFNDIKTFFSILCFYIIIYKDNAHFLTITFRKGVTSIIRV